MTKKQEQCEKFRATFLFNEIVKKKIKIYIKKSAPHRLVDRVCCSLTSFFLFFCCVCDVCSSVLEFAEYLHYCMCERETRERGTKFQSNNLKNIYMYIIKHQFVFCFSDSPDCVHNLFSVTSKLPLNALQYNLSTSKNCQPCCSSEVDFSIRQLQRISFSTP